MWESRYEMSGVVVKGKFRMWCLGKECNDEQLGMYSFFVVDFL